jgi:hypothetical protein
MDRKKGVCKNIQEGRKEGGKEGRKVGRNTTTYFHHLGQNTQCIESAAWGIRIKPLVCGEMHRSIKNHSRNQDENLYGP